MKFSIKHFFSECDQIRRKLQIRSHLLKKSFMENFIGRKSFTHRCKMFQCQTLSNHNYIGIDSYQVHLYNGPHNKRLADNYIHFYLNDHCKMFMALQHTQRKICRL